MKFGKTIQARQIPGWGPYYLDYKFLKKIINSLASHRPASEASLLALGIRPTSSSLSPTSSFSTPTLLPTSNDSLTQSAAEQARQQLEFANASATGMSMEIPDLDLEPLPPGSAPPGDGNSMLGGGGGVRERDQDRGESFKAHRAVFFFKLGRELEKINAFYLTKERDLRLRLLTLLNNRQRLLVHLARSSTAGPDEIDDLSGGVSTGDSTTRKGVEWQALEEGWRLFERDMGKLQQFVEINAEGFRKILKKWDKRSKSSTKELYLERQVEVQPCFNREFIAKMADVVAANLLDLEHGSGHLNTSFLSDLPESLGGDHLAFNRKADYEVEGDTALTVDAFSDLEYDLNKVIYSGNIDALKDWFKTARERQQQLSLDQSRIMRILWRAIEEVPLEFVGIITASVSLDFSFVDPINGRSPLHESCIKGKLELAKLCVANGVKIEGQDTYERRPLHYAAMHGHADVCQYLLDQGASGTPTDMDGYTPLIQAVIAGQLDCVKIFTATSGSQMSLEPTAISNDLIPLSLACQYGHLEVAQLLLRSGAKVLPNSEGLFPQHLAARAGHAPICQLLVDEGGANGGGKDRADKYNAWTPLHHATIGGSQRHLDCVKVLVQAKCDVNAGDEYGKTPGFYAAWYGQIECLDYLIANGAHLQTIRSPSHLGKMAGLALSTAEQTSMSPTSDGEDDLAMDLDGDLIPSLSLPPPIIPLRMYGHDFLAKRSMVQITLGQPFSEVSSDRAVTPVRLYSRKDDDHPLSLWSSLKLVMASKSDVTSIPHSVVLPLADEREIFSFQVDDLQTFTLELSLYPTFGSKVIGRAVLLPSAFENILKSKTVIAPLLDHHLKAIGEVAFHVQCIRPFDGAQLEIGGRVETYWKATVAASAAGASQDHAHQFQPHRPLSVATSSPSMPSALGASVVKKDASKESGFVTASSLSGEYVHLVVQVTRDYIPVVYPVWRLPVDGFDVGISDVTYAQVQQLAIKLGRTYQAAAADIVTGSKPSDWCLGLNNALAGLQEVLTYLPVEIGVNLEIRYTSSADAKREGFSSILDLNKAVDAVLNAVYEAARASTPTAEGSKRSRKFIFSGFDSTLCTHIQLKQPNFAVFYSSYCNVSRFTSSLSQATVNEESLSVREAVKLAKSQNMLGLALDCRLMAAVPSLVQSVKDAGLLLIAFGPEESLMSLRKLMGDKIPLDGYYTAGLTTLTA